MPVVNFYGVVDLLIEEPLDMDIRTIFPVAKVSQLTPSKL